MFLEEFQNVISYVDVEDAILEWHIDYPFIHVLRRQASRQPIQPSSLPLSIFSSLMNFGSSISQILSRSHKARF
jgi:hypothetical protein